MKDETVAKQLINGVADVETDGVANGTKTHNDVRDCDGARKRIHGNHSQSAGTVDEHEPFHDDIPTRIQILTDWANICTFLGAILATLAMASMWNRRYYLGMFLNVLANIADILDGPIARSLPDRHPVFSVVGCKLDCYSDLVSHFVVPASLLMSISDLNSICVILAALYVCSGILRQSYFEVTGRCADGACIYGMTSDYMVVIYCLTMHLMPVVGSYGIVFVLSGAVMFMMFASLTFSLRSRRYDGFGLFTVTLFNVLLCLSCFALVLFEANEDFGFMARILLVVHLVLAYPCYFRFVELNN